MSLNRRTLLTGLLTCPVCAGAAHAADVHWSYEGQGGPKKWGELEKDFAACSLGGQQSPVDLDGAVAAQAERPVLSWKPQAFKVVNNGHTIQADAVDEVSTLTLGGTTYTLRQFHFHAPSEHAVKGQRTAMEVHFVHDAPEGGAAVIGVFLTPGKANETFAELMKKAPGKAGEKVPLDGLLDPSALIPAGGPIYRYEGSLTTPPCAEVVNWNIFADPVEVAQSDIDAFRAFFPMNARPLQATNRRFLLRVE